MRRHLHRCCPAVLLVVLTAGCTSWSGARWGGFRPKPTFAAPDREELARSPDDPPLQDEEREPASASRGRSRPKIAPSEREGITQSRPAGSSRSSGSASPSGPQNGPSSGPVLSASSGNAPEAEVEWSSEIEAPEPSRSASPSVAEIRLASAEEELPDLSRPEAEAETTSPDKADSVSWSRDALDESPGWRSDLAAAADSREAPDRTEPFGVESENESTFSRRSPALTDAVVRSDDAPLAARPTTDRRAAPAAEEETKEQRAESRHAAATHRLPGLDPMFPPRLSDWDPTKFIGRKKTVDAARPAEPLESPSRPIAESGIQTPPPYAPSLYEGNPRSMSEGVVQTSATGRMNRAAGESGAARETGMSPDGEAARISIDSNSSYTTDELRRVITLFEAEALAQVPDATPDQQRDYVRRHIHLRLLQLVAGQTSEAQKPIPGIDPVDQEFWNSVLWGLETYFDRERVPDPAERTALTASQFQAAARHLQATARLELKNVAFCHRIDGFGTFERFPRDEFEAGVPILIYSEVRNFGSEPVADGHFRTVLKSTVEIVRLAQQNAVIERLSFEPTEDLSRSPRTDFYNSYKIQLPATLTPGPYLLRLLVEDETSGKTASQTLQFSIR